MRVPVAVIVGILGLLGLEASAWAEEAQANYHPFFGMDPRKTVWFVAQLHLFFGAFVLGVPIFAAVIEYTGYKTREIKYDRLAYEFTSLLSVAYATTAAIGAVLIFVFLGLYPVFTWFMMDTFREVVFLYAFLFFGETFCLYLYYYGWGWMNNEKPFPRGVVRLFQALGGVTIAAGAAVLTGVIGHLPGNAAAYMATITVILGLGFLMIRHMKGTHIFIGVLLNVFGTLIMLLANSWAAFMMSPVMVDEKTHHFMGTAFQAVLNPLWIPLGIHRMLGNVAFGGFVAGAYAAVKFIGSTTREERAHYDWMGYVSNFVGICGLIPLPFAGYYLGREVYSNSAVMGNNMMGGDFSWTFIMQAMLVGTLFMVSCYYLWCGMGRIPGAERYTHLVKYFNAFILISFAIWLTPHNLPLTGEEVSQMGGSQYHPTLKFMGLMPAKNAVINLIILSTFCSFLLYRRGNRGKRVPISEQGNTPKIVIPAVALFCIWFVGSYAYGLYTMDPGTMDLPADRIHYFQVVAKLLFTACAMMVVVVALTLRDQGILAQYVYIGFISFSVVLFLGVFGFVVMEKASPFLRNIAVSQFIQLLSCLILVTTVDIFLFRDAESLGEMKWGEMPIRSQYALLLLCIVITLNMGLMGFIRSGLRTDWHIYGVMRDTSEWAYTPSNYTMSQMVSFATVVFLVSVAFMFWLSAIAGSKGKGTQPEEQLKPA